MQILRITLLAWMALLTTACSGQLFIAETACSGSGCSCKETADCTDGYDCKDGICLGPCSAVSPDGNCSDGGTCNNGVCGEWCSNCTAEQACVNEICVSINTGNECSIDNPNGYCAGNAACVGGACIIIDPDNSCSPSNHAGYCPTGAVCVSGECRPVTEDACSLDNLDGRCQSGLECVEGVCRVPPCSPTFVAGRCDAGQFCSSSGTCINDGSCASDDDCETFFTCQASACVRDTTCVSDGDCFPIEFCSTVGECAEDGQCLADADCDVGQACGNAFTCVAEGSCVTDTDCTPAQFCSVNDMCINDGTCNADGDCPPGNACDANACGPSGDTCTINVNDPVTSCPNGETCCPEGQRCSADDLCIPDGSCIDDSDCLTGAEHCTNYACVPNVLCTEGCGVGEYCSFSGGCIPNGACSNDGDCAEGEVCSALFQCRPGTNCGSTEFQTTLVPPNMLIVLDRSGSMNECVSGSLPSKWDDALDALNLVMADHGDQVRFGLSVFPASCPTTAECTTSCSSGNGSGCIDCGSNAGVVNVAVGESTNTAISSTMSAVYPGGATPTGPTLRAIVADQAAYGLPDAADTIARANYVLLVTDGEPNSDSACSPDAQCVNGAVEQLAGLAQDIKTYVVGFAFSTPSDTLNCNAVMGGTSRCGTDLVPDTCTGAGDTRSCTCRAAPRCGDGSCDADENAATCPDDCTDLPALASHCEDDADCSTGECRNGICSKCDRNSDCGPTNSGRACGQPSTCAHAYCTAGSAIPSGKGTCDVPSQADPVPPAPLCYFEADNATTLSAAFNDIVGEVASCSYSLGSAPPDENLLYVYLDYSGALIKLDRDPSHTENWDYSPISNQVTFYGSACNDVKATTATPRVIYGCPTGG